MDSQGVVLSLIGQGNLEIPADLQHKVVKRIDLNYTVSDSETWASKSEALSC